MKQALKEKKAALNRKLHEYERLEPDSSATRTAIGRRKGVMRDLAERICTLHTLKSCM